MTASNAVLSSRAGWRSDEGIRVDRAQALPVSLQRAVSRRAGAEVGGDRGGTGNAQDIAARDDAHLVSLGIKPELRRTLGFLSNFAIAFSFISVSTGIVRQLRRRHRLGGPAFFWSWPIVIVGQFIVALVFAELASHFPVAGSIYQWSKRLSNRTLGWFTGWFYFWAQVVTVTAVAVIVAFVDRRHPRARSDDGRRSSTRGPDRAHDDVHVHLAA